LSVFFSIDLCQISSLVKYRRKKQQQTLVRAQTVSRTALGIPSNDDSDNSDSILITIIGSMIP